jgi:hypothetical protein
MESGATNNSSNEKDFYTHDLNIKMVENYDEPPYISRILGLFSMETINIKTGVVIEPPKHFILKSICDGSLYEKDDLLCEYYDHVKQIKIILYSPTVDEGSEDDFLSDKFILIKELPDNSCKNYLCEYEFVNVTVP